MSAAQYSTFTPVSPASEARSRSISAASPNPLSITLAPARASVLAMANPIPLVDPVTIADCPFSGFISGPQGQDRAGSTIPRHSPKPTRAAPGFSHQPRKMIASPSSSQDRVSPSGKLNGCLPPTVSSMSAPA